MYITAHQVRDSAGKEAIHSFRYRHDLDACPFPANPLDVPRNVPGILEKESRVLLTTGNAVLSYLDLIAPESTQTNRWRAQLDLLVTKLPGRSLPVAVQLGELALVFWAELDIGSPLDEYRILVDAALQMLPSQT